mmetsp:Transcript_96786/g.174798  ORF Transcript_96786/g.174798 Transcript_96786/m.174798 type:complete len:246 (-) Transcript_96786:522-1259(-)
MTMSLPVRKVIHDTHCRRGLEDLMHQASISLMIRRIAVRGRPEGRRCGFSGAIRGSLPVGCRSADVRTWSRPGRQLRRLAARSVGKAQLPAHSVVATYCRIGEAHVLRALVAIHGWWLLRLLLSAVCRMLPLTEKLQLVSDLAQLLFAEGPEDHGEAAALLREVYQKVPEGRQDLVTAVAHDVLRLGLRRIFGGRLLIENRLLDVIGFGQSLVGVLKVLHHLVIHSPELCTRLARTGELSSLLRS